ncbi:MAG: PQQ-binding-like beta-propeller repeat protein, partial [Acidimicrobiia bacterium]
MSLTGRKQIQALAATLAVLALAAPACSQRAVAPDQNLNTGIGFRGGPDRAGVIEGSGPAQPKVQWSIDAGGHVISSPIPLADGIVVVGGDGSLRRIDLDGTQQWSRQIGASEATPVVVGDVVLEPDSSGSLFAVSVNDGEVIWKKALGGSVRSSPLVANGQLIDGVDDEVLTVDISDGSVVHRFPLGASTGSSPALSEGAIVIGDADNQVVALDIANGSKLWFHDFGHPSMPQTFFRVADGVVAT